MLKFDYLNDPKTVQPYVIAFRTDDGMTGFLFAATDDLRRELEEKLHDEERPYLSYKMMNWDTSINRAFGQT